jgi:hypothetical protein
MHEELNTKEKVKIKTIKYEKHSIYYKYLYDTIKWINKTKEKLMLKRIQVIKPTIYIDYVHYNITVSFVYFINHHHSLFLSGKFGGGGQIKNTKHTCNFPLWALSTILIIKHYS